MTKQTLSEHDYNQKQLFLVHVSKAFSMEMNGTSVSDTHVLLDYLNDHKSNLWDCLRYACDHGYTIDDTITQEMTHFLFQPDHPDNAASA